MFHRCPHRVDGMDPSTCSDPKVLVELFVLTEIPTVWIFTSTDSLDRSDGYLNRSDIFIYTNDVSIIDMMIEDISTF